MGHSISPEVIKVNFTIVAELAYFFISLLIVRKYVWPLLIALLDARRAKIEASLSEAERARQAVVACEDRKKALLEEASTSAIEKEREAEAKAALILENARKSGEQVKRSLLQEGQNEVARAREEAKASLNDEIVTMAIAVTESWLNQQKGWTPEALDRREAQQVIQSFKLRSEAQLLGSRSLKVDLNDRVR